MNRVSFVLLLWTTEEGLHTAMKLFATRAPAGVGAFRRALVLCRQSAGAIPSLVLCKNPADAWRAVQIFAALFTKDRDAKRKEQLAIVAFAAAALRHASLPRTQMSARAQMDKELTGREAAAGVIASIPDIEDGNEVMYLQDVFGSLRRVRPEMPGLCVTVAWHAPWQLAVASAAEVVSLTPCSQTTGAAAACVHC
jgi:hypothetical protein